MAGKAKTTKVGRDSGSGEFITVKKARENPKTTTVETVKKRGK